MGEPDSYSHKPPLMVSSRGPAKGGREHGGDPGVAKMETPFPGLEPAQEGWRAGRSRGLNSPRTLPAEVGTSCPGPREPSVDSPPARSLMPAADPAQDSGLYSPLWSSWAL